MKTTIAGNGFFDLSVDQEKNRLFITSKGFWTDDIVDEYAKNQTIAIEKLKKGFTVVADMRTFKTLSQDLVKKQEKTHIELVEAGMYKVAEILPGSVIASMQLKQVTAKNDIPNKQFSTIEEGEAWLDTFK